MSSAFSSEFDAHVAIDGLLDTITASTLGTSEWLSVQIPDGTPIGHVVVYNRLDGEQNQAFLSPFEVRTEVAPTSHNLAHQPSKMPRSSHLH